MNLPCRESSAPSDMFVSCFPLIITRENNIFARAELENTMTIQTSQEPRVRDSQNGHDELDKVFHSRKSSYRQPDRSDTEDDTIHSDCASWGGEDEHRDTKDGDKNAGYGTVFLGHGLLDDYEEEDEYHVSQINLKYRTLMAEEEKLAAAASKFRMEQYNEFMKQEAEMDSKRRIKKLELLEKQRMDEIATAR